MHGAFGLFIFADLRPLTQQEDLAAILEMACLHFKPQSTSFEMYRLFAKSRVSFVQSTSRITVVIVKQYS